MQLLLAPNALRARMRLLQAPAPAWCVPKARCQTARACLLVLLAAQGVSPTLPILAALAPLPPTAQEACRVQRVPPTTGGPQRVHAARVLQAPSSPKTLLPHAHSVPLGRISPGARVCLVRWGESLVQAALLAVCVEQARMPRGLLLAPIVQLDTSRQIPVWPTARRAPLANSQCLPPRVRIAKWASLPPMMLNSPATTAPSTTSQPQRAQWLAHHAPLASSPLR